jgi:hypothetical protein
LLLLFPVFSFFHSPASFPSTLPFSFFLLCNNAADEFFVKHKKTHTQKKGEEAEREHTNRREKKKKKEHEEQSSSARQEVTPKPRRKLQMGCKRKSALAHVQTHMHERLPRTAERKYRDGQPQRWRKIKHPVKKRERKLHIKKKNQEQRKKTRSQ